MTAQLGDKVDRRRILAKIAPFVILPSAGIAVRTPLATAHPFPALILFLWIVAATLMLSLVARSSGKPKRSAILAVLAGASITVWLGSPPAARVALIGTPILVLTMAT